MTRFPLAILVASALFAQPAAAQAPKMARAERTGLAPDMITQRWTGDFDGIVERRLVRVLTVYSKTFFFLDKGRERGTVHGERAERREAREELMPRK
jgi:hypothetical protein